MREDLTVRRALFYSPLLMLLAATKFRHRDPGATLEGAIDAQILFEVAMFAIAGIIAARALRAATAIRARRTPAETVLVCYAGLALLSVVWSPIRSITFVRAAELVTVVLLAIAVFRFLRPGEFVRSLAVSLPLYVASGAAAALALPGIAGGVFNRSAQGVPRFSWFSVHPSLSATFAAIGIIVLLPLLGQRIADRKPVPATLLGFGALVVLFVVLAATRARTELAALLLTLAAMGIRRWLQPRSRVALALLLVAAGLGFWVLVSPWIGDAIDVYTMSDTQIVDFVLRGQTLDEFTSVSGRVELWKRILPLVIESPVVGHGYLASRSVLQRTVYWASYAHNAPLQSLLDLGFVGTILIWGLAFRAFWLGAITPVARQREAVTVGQVIFGILVFQLLVAGAGESFVGVPGFRVFVFCVSAMLALRIWTGPSQSGVG